MILICFILVEKIKCLFAILNSELENIKCLSPTSYPVTWKNVKYSYFHKPNKRKIPNKIPLLLPVLNVNNLTIAQFESIKFLDIFLDEHLTWSNIKNTEKKFKTYRLVQEITITTDIQLRTSIHFAKLTAGIFKLALFVKTYF